MPPTTVDHRATRPAPRLAGLPVIGSALDLRRDPLGTLRRAERTGPVVEVVAGPPGWRHRLFAVTHPDGVERVLVQDHLRMTKQAPQYGELRAALGDGLFTSEGEVWHRQRRFVAPVLTRRRVLGSYAPVAVTEMAAVAERWEQAARTGASVDVHADMVGFTVRFVCRVLLGADVENALPVLSAVATDFNTGVVRRSQSPHPSPRWLPTPTNRRLAAAVRAHRSLVEDLVARRRAAGTGGDDLLGLLLAARDPAPGSGAVALSDREVSDQVRAFLLAGHETTATTLALALLRLAADGHWQQVVSDEVASVVGDRLPEAADLPALVRTEHVVKEVLRLWPSAPTTVRLAPDGDDVLGYRIPPGAVVLLSPYATHHSPDLWPDPDRFDPDRFADPLPGGHRYAWIPFGAGPHACVGAQLAMTEAVLGLAVLLQRFRLRTHLADPPLDVGIVLRPGGRLPVVPSLR